MPDARITITATDAVSDVLARINDAMKTTGGVTVEVSDAMKNMSGDADSAAQALKGAFERPLDSVKGLASAIQDQVVGSLGALGPIVEGGIVVLGALGGALVELASHAREVAEGIDRVSTSFGLAIGPLSDLKFAIESAGGSFDNINNLMFMFEQRMTNSSQKVQDGLQLIGLSLSDLSNLSPDQMLLKISDAMRANEGSANLAAAAFDLFGRQGRDQLPTLLKPLSDLAQQSKDFGATMGTDDVKAAAEFQLSLTNLAAQTSATWTQLGLHVSIADEFVYAYDRMKLAVANVAYDLGQLVTGFGYFSTAWELLSGQLSSMPAVNSSLKGLADGSGLAAKGLSDFQKSVSDQKLPITDATDAWNLYDQQVGTVQQQLAGATKAIDEQAKQQGIWQKAMDDLNNSGSDWHDTLTGIDGEVVAAAEYYLDAGVSASTLKTAYELTDVQVQALVSDHKDYAKTLKDVQAVEDAKNGNSMYWLEKLGGAKQVDSLQDLKNVITSTEADGKLWDDYYDDLAGKSGTASDKQIAAVKKWYDDQVDKAVKAGTANQTFYDDLYTIAEKKMKDVQDLNDPFKKAFTLMLSDMTTGPGGWNDTFSNKMAGALTGGNGFSDVVKGVWDKMRTDFQGVLAGIMDDLLNKFLGPAESAFANWLSDIVGIGSSGTSGGGGGSTAGWLASLIGGGGDHGSGGNGSGGNGEDPGQDPGGGRGDFGPAQPQLPFGPGAGTLPPNSAPGAGDLGLSEGGIVYAAWGWPRPRGTDTVPAMLTPGERVLAVQDTQTFDRAGGLPALRSGGFGGAPDTTAIANLHTELRGLRSDLAIFTRNQPMMLKHALRGA